MLPVTSIARVVVNTIRASFSPSAFDTGLLLVPDASFTEDRRLMIYPSGPAAAAGLTELGFTADSEVYKAVLKYFAASPAPGRLLVSCYPASQSPGEALDAVLERTADFYGVMPASDLNNGELVSLAQHVEALEHPAVFFAPVTSFSAEAGGTLDLLYRNQFKRTLPFCCGTLSDCAAVMGTAMGLELSHTASAFALCYKTVNGIQPEDLTQTQVDSVKAKNGNVYIARGYTHFLLENGTMANGQRYDEVLYIDKIGADLQNAAVTLLAENPDKLPQTDDSTAQFINRFSSILMGYTERGVLASSVWRGADIGPVRGGEIIENGFMLWADSYDDQPDADRAAHKAMPVQVALTPAGSIESIVITVNVQV
ncbi:DUF3383 family protein [Aristaeella hokkaidonensis]|uniref:DUF3383 family protein n=1 Tax=Aristaeella hokkaidonensis TaxID=3046382 RepID=A0AC61MUW4_9FIRM|nr:DUF3383 family protein [Aristaeella hokkaidonensis]QUC66204.1 DUF3383 family protein [Aristaeella hokkaidonensis]SNT94788.1 Protein of unknown function [Aristaeella hokkaidonensis]